MANKILVIEDNRRNRTLIRDVLSYHGYEIVEASDGEEGVRKGREHRPDIILLDIQMPVMDGFTALQLFRGMPETRDVKVIALTSFAMAGDREKILKAGFDGYIAKPVDTRQLPLIVKRHIREG